MRSGIVLARKVRRRVLKEQTKIYSGEEGFSSAGLVEVKTENWVGGLR
jgi:hypothetical protein